MFTYLNPFDMAKERSKKKCSISCHRQTKCHVRWSGVLSLVPDSHTAVTQSWSSLAAHLSRSEMMLFSMLLAWQNVQRKERWQSRRPAYATHFQPLPSVATVTYFFCAYPQPTDTHVLEGMGKSYGSFLSSMFYAQLQNPKILKERNNTQL